jgi:hypothetical protein
MTFEFHQQSKVWDNWSGIHPGHNLALGKAPLYPLNMRLLGPRAGLDAETRREILCPCQGLNPDHPACDVTTLNELPWLLIQRRNIA